MRVHGEFQPHLSPGGGRADRHAGSTVGPARREESGGFTERFLPLKMIYSPLYLLGRVLIHTGMRAVQMKIQDHLISIELS